VRFFWQHASGSFKTLPLTIEKDKITKNEKAKAFDYSNSNQCK